MFKDGACIYVTDVNNVYGIYGCVVAVFAEMFNIVITKKLNSKKLTI